ncbi:MAG: SCO family protein [Bacteroidetes bacterium]|nr:SCO family protein [Bacteroidota bacterium]
MYGQPDLQTDNDDVGIEEQLNDTIPLDVTLINENGEPQQLSELIDKPTVLSFVYYRCPGICGPLMGGIADVVDKTDLQIGTDYQVFTISFDPSETAPLAKRKKTNYINTMQNKNAGNGWYFFTGDSTNISRLTKATGFKYKQQGNDFLHAGALIAVTEHGKITRYVNGTSFLPFEFKMAIIETSKGKAGPTINKVLQLCFQYDPAGQRYVLNITRVAGTIIMIAALGIFLTLTIRRRKKQSANN